MRGESGELEPASWPEALEAAATGLLAARSRAGVLTGGRLTVEDAYAYSKFARVALDTNDIDFRARVHSGEEADFLAARVAGRGRDLDGTGVTYTALEKAPAVLLAGFESEEEAPGVFLRLRKAWRGHGQKTFSLATHATRGLEKAGGTLLPAAPGTETEWLDALASGAGLEGDGAKAAEALRTEGAVIVVGERLAAVAGGLTAAVRASTATGAQLVWIPRRAGERGAIEAGALPSLLPGGRPATDPRARDEVAAGLGHRGSCRTATAVTPDRSSRPPPPGSSPRSSSRASRSPTFPTRHARVKHSPRWASWCRSNCAPVRSPSTRTSSSPSPRSPRRRAPSSTGKAAHASSSPRSSPSR